MSMHKGLIGKDEGGASAKNLQNSGQEVTQVSNEQYLHQYIERKTENRGELGNYPFNLNITTTKDYSKDFAWVAEFIDNKDGCLPLTAHFINDTLHIQGHGSALVLLPNGRWFMSDTSGA